MSLASAVSTAHVFFYFVFARFVPFCFNASIQYFVRLCVGADVKATCTQGRARVCVCCFVTTIDRHPEWFRGLCYAVHEALDNSRTIWPKPRRHTAWGLLTISFLQARALSRYNHHAQVPCLPAGLWEGRRVFTVRKSARWATTS